MSLIRPVGYETLSCGCRLGRYLRLETGGEIAYLEAKGLDCTCRRHRPNRPVSSTGRSHPAPRLSAERWAAQLT